MLNLHSVVITVIFSVIQVQCSQDDVLVKTPNGLIRGVTAQTRKGRNIFSFHGIRYAEPPIGESRFKPPVPVKPWSDTYNATQTGQACLQPKPESSYTLSEDCLFLDVHTPKLKTRKPVIVFIHGGAFLMGAKSDVSPDYLLDKDVVLVSVNYRLGPFGFFTTGTYQASGNLAFKDQNLALKWVQNNIIAFGGDPNSVTLCGHSAGSYSVSAHLVSPMSRGLFHRAIVMSGSILANIETPVRNSSEALLHKVGCSNKNASVALQCVQKVSAESILAVVDLDAILAWYYDIETESCGEPFFKDSPLEIARSGGLSKVPIIAGVNFDEFLFLANGWVSSNSSEFTRLNNDFDKAVPSIFHFENNLRAKEISQKIQTFYFNNQPIKEADTDHLGQMISDLILGHGEHQLVELQRKHSQVYYYHFEYQGRYSHAYKKDGSPLGIIHGDELQYIFVFKKIAPIFHETDPENDMIERMTSWWVNFAKTGNPNNPADKRISNMMWPPTNKENIQSYRINTTCKVLPEHNADRYKLLDTLFPL